SNSLIRFVSIWTASTVQITSTLITPAGAELGYPSPVTRMPFGRFVGSKSFPSFLLVHARPGVAFPPVGRLGLTSPRSSVLCSATTAPCPSRVASLPLAPRYLVCFLTLCSLWLGGGWKLSTAARALGQPVPLLFRPFEHGDTGLSQVPEFPLRGHAPLSSDPGG